MFDIDETGVEFERRKRPQFLVVCESDLSHLSIVRCRSKLLHQEDSCKREFLAAAISPEYDGNCSVEYDGGFSGPRRKKWIDIKV